MLPTSDELESYHQRLRNIDGTLTKYKTAEVTKSDLIAALRELAKEWLKHSGILRQIESIESKKLDSFDQQMQEVLESTSSRARASTYRKRIAPLVSGFVESVVIPVIKHEGSPAQVAARQLVAEFSSPLTPEEMAYIDEAARCLAVKCHRASIVLLWAAGIARLHKAIERVGYNTYNTSLHFRAKGLANAQRVPLATRTPPMWHFAVPGLFLD